MIWLNYLKPSLGVQTARNAEYKYGENQQRLLQSQVGGIGIAIAESQEFKGFDLGTNCFYQKPQLRAWRNYRRKNCHVVLGDISNAEDCKRMVEEVIEEQGQIDAG